MFRPAKRQTAPSTARYSPGNETVMEQQGDHRGTGRGGSVHPLAGKDVWIISDGKAGHEVQMLGVAEALGATPIIKRIAEPGRLYKLVAPYGRPPRLAHFGEPKSDFTPPWPALALATGRLTTPYIRALKRKAGLAAFTVILLDPKTGPASADLFWVPEHDKRRGANVIRTLTSPHRYSAQRLGELRSTMPPEIAALPEPRIAVLVGGPNGDYRYAAADQTRLAAILAGLAAQGAGLMITTSRRTPPQLLASVDAATRGAARLLWAGEGPNPYPAFLAHADAFLVTADSVNMAGEAAATGKPIHIFHPSGGSQKFDRFHAALEAQGITRRLDDATQIAARWTYAPVNSASVIAEDIERRILARARFIPGLCG